MVPDFGLTARDYGRHRAGFPDSFFERLADLGIGGADLRVVDLGTGTGSVARGFARRGARVIGIDPSAPMLDEARRIAAAEGVVVAFRAGRAEATGLPARSADVVTAGQCWHWFDRPKAAAEVMRLLRPGGSLVIAHFDWLALPGNVVEATEALIKRHNPAWTLGGGVGIYPAWLHDLANAGFKELETFSYDVTVLYSHEDWRGRIRASAGVGASLPPAEIARFDEAHAALLTARFPNDPLPIPHRVFAVLGRAPAVS